MFIVWVARPKMVDAAFDTWILPLLGIIFLPLATLIYVILYTVGVGLSGGTGSGWVWLPSSISCTGVPGGLSDDMRPAIRPASRRDNGRLRHHPAGTFP